MNLHHRGLVVVTFAQKSLRQTRNTKKSNLKISSAEMKPFEIWFLARKRDFGLVLKSQMKEIVTRLVFLVRARWLSCGLYYKIYNVVFTPLYRSKEVSVESIHRYLLSSVRRRRLKFYNTSHWSQKQPVVF